MNLLADPASTRISREAGSFPAGIGTAVALWNR